MLVTAVVVAALSDGGGDEPDAAAPLPRPQPPAASGVFNDPDVGVAVTRPEGWTARRRRGAVRLRSRDRSIVIAVSSPARASQTRAVLESALEAIRGEYTDVQVEEGEAQTLAGRPTESAVVSATSSRGTRLRVLVAAVTGRRRAYLVEVFAARDASERRLAEAQVALNSLRLGK